MNSDVAYQIEHYIDKWGWDMGSPRSYREGLVFVGFKHLSSTFEVKFLGTRAIIEGLRSIEGCVIIQKMKLR